MRRQVLADAGTSVKADEALLQTAGQGLEQLKAKPAEQISAALQAALCEVAWRAAEREPDCDSDSVTS